MRLAEGLSPPCPLNIWQCMKVGVQTYVACHCSIFTPFCVSLKHLSVSLCSVIDWGTSCLMTVWWYVLYNKLQNNSSMAVILYTYCLSLALLSAVIPLRPHRDCSTKSLMACSLAILKGRQSHLSMGMKE